VAGKSTIWQGGMEKAPENGKESSHSAHVNRREQNWQSVCVLGVGMTTTYVTSITI
jgi:hypothetical protein